MTSAIAICMFVLNTAWAQVPPEEDSADVQPTPGTTDQAAAEPPAPAPEEDDRLGREGESCTRTADCRRGLRCIAQSCTAESQAAAHPGKKQDEAKTETQTDAGATDSGSSDSGAEVEEDAESRWAGFFATGGLVYGGVTSHSDAGLGGGISVGKRLNRIVGWTVFVAAVDIPEKGFSENDTAWAAMGGLHAGNIVFGQVLVGALRGNERVGFTRPDTGDEIEITVQTTVFGAGLSGGFVIPFSRSFGITMQGFAAKGLETEGFVVFGMLGPTLRATYSGER